MAAGQHADLSGWIGSDEGSVDRYWQVATAKSGVLFALACRAGARLGNPSDEILTAYADFGRALGQLIQVCDDYMDGSLARCLCKIRRPIETSRLQQEVDQESGELRSPLLDAFGLASAIRAHSEEVGEQQGLGVQLALDDDEDWQLPEEIAVSLFRIHQEVLSNVIRHANAGKVVVRLYREGSKVTLEVQDDGTGFAVPDSMDKLATEGHFGLLGIRERVALLKGEFELASQPGDGTRVRVRVPIQP